MNFCIFMRIRVSSKKNARLYDTDYRSYFMLSLTELFSTTLTTSSLTLKH